MKEGEVEDDIDSDNDIDTLDMRAADDTTTIVTYDIDGFLDQVIQETNQGYINSKVPLRVKLLCHEEAPGTFSSHNAINEFERIKGGKGGKGGNGVDYKAILGSADQAALLLKDYGGCGRARGINMIPSGKMISVTKKSCALGYYSFGHELAHNIGLAHNRETGHYNGAFSYGQAYLIKRGKGKASTGFRTILGYNYPGHRERVNYYSNPDVIYPRTLTPTGTSVDNNARVLTLQRFKLADIGDESDYQCSGAPPPTTTQT